MKKVSIITGGSRGIGEAMALKLGEEGYNVVINYRSDSSKELSEKLAAKISKDYNVETLVVKADVSKYEDCENLIKAAVEKFGDKIDVLVNNAGITNNCNWIDIKREQYENVINTNLMSFLHMTHLTLPYMINHSSKDSQCCIVNTSSIGGLIGVINQADYCASKAGIIGLTRALALEFAGKGIRVNAIAPGFISTDMTKDLDAEKISEHIPLKRLGTPQDIAVTAKFLASEATYITGQVIGVDGGLVT